MTTNRQLVFSATKKDFKVETFPAGGPGGQHQNKTDSAVRITHVESGISAECRSERSQHYNKRTAFEKLVRRLIDHYVKQEQKERFAAGKETIRTYHEPRGTAKDHRTGVTLPLKNVLDGDIDKFIDAMMGLKLDDKYPVDR